MPTTKKPAAKNPPAVKGHYGRELFKVTHPNERDKQIKAWKKNMVDIFKKMGIKPPIEVNAVYNGNTHKVSMALARAVGINVAETFKNGLGPQERDKIKKAADKKTVTKKEETYRKSLKKRWDAPKPAASTSGTLNGIDVSAYQPSNVTAAVPGDFAVIKATEGLTYVSPVFTVQLSNAKHAGKLVGLYHFADGDDPEHEAQHFYNTVRPYLGQALMVLDFEGPALSHGASWAKAFLDHFHYLSGVKCLIYGSTGNICNSSFASVAANYELWAAAYPSMSPMGYNPRIAFVSVSPWKTTRMRQYSSAGRLNGYSGNLDLDVFYGNRDLWRQLCKKS